MKPPGLGRIMRYEFVLAERVTSATMAAFPELHESHTITSSGAVLYGRVVDGPHLHGLLDRFQTMGLTVLEMRRLPD